MPDYPLSERMQDRLRTPTGLRCEEITLEAVMQGRIRMEDLRVTSEALELQAEVADEARRPQLAANLRRAAELVDVPEAEILKIYNALRPGRATPAELQHMAGTLEEKYGARGCAEFLREAAGETTCGNRQADDLPGRNA